MSVGLGNVRQARWEIFALITAPMDGVGIIPRLTGNAARPFFLKIESEVPVDVHPLVQDSHDVDGAFASHPIEQRV